MVEPASTNLNIDTVVLVCEEGRKGRLLQLQLYQTEEGLLAPTYAHSTPPKDDPRAELSIDGRRFPVVLFFSENYTVLADDHDGRFPRLSNRLLSAMETGKTMKLRVDLLAEPKGPPAFDAEATVNLQSHGRAEAIGAMRRCADAPKRHSSKGH
jgi:hypothetical protein